jgi:hypothetical protein
VLHCGLDEGYPLTVAYPHARGGGYGANKRKSTGLRRREIKQIPLPYGIVQLAVALQGLLFRES